MPKFDHGFCAFLAFAAGRPVLQEQRVKEIISRLPAVKSRPRVIELFEQLAIPACFRYWIWNNPVNKNTSISLAWNKLALQAVRGTPTVHRARVNIAPRPVRQVKDATFKISRSYTVPYSPCRTKKDPLFLEKLQMFFCRKGALKAWTPTVSRSFFCRSFGLCSVLGFLI